VSAVVAFTLHLQGADGEPSKPMSWQETHQWQFDASGLVRRFRQRSDIATAKAPSDTRGRLLPFARPLRVMLAWQ
jgi:hypothetical protein